jgi:hypothetical protein
VGEQSLRPGDVVHLRSGDVFEGTLHVRFRSGTPQPPVVVRSSGRGRAILTGSANSAVYVEDGGVELCDLEVRGGPGAAATYDGISLFAGGGRRARAVRISGCVVTGWRNGISVGGDAGGGFDDVLISDCELVANRDQGLLAYGPRLDPAAPRYAHTAMTVAGVRAWGTTGDAANTAAHSGSGIVLGSVRGGLVERCAAWENGARCPAGEGPVGIWAYDSSGVVIRRCVSYGNRTGGPADGGGFGLDVNTSDSSIEDCVAYDNDGAGVLLFAASDNAMFTGNRVIGCQLRGNARRSDFYAEITIMGNVSSTLVQGNVLVASDGPGGRPAAVAVHGTGARGVVFRGNVVATAGRGELVTGTDSALREAATWQDNVLHRFGG